MESIDLGNNEKINVKIGTSVYPMKVPTALKAYEYSKKIKNVEDGEEITIFLRFVCDLGMPENAAKNLTVSQLTTLADNLMGVGSKKN